MEEIKGLRAFLFCNDIYVQTNFVLRRIISIETNRQQQSGDRPVRAHSAVILKNEGSSRIVQKDSSHTQNDMLRIWVCI